MTVFEAAPACCETRDTRPAPVANRPGLPALAYRVGTHGRFNAAMLRALARHPDLAALTARAADDPTIALVDAWATVLDVLTFYQERIANEGYLATATERRSILELARAIGYELNPGVAATGHLVFTVQAAPGASETITLAKGLKVQSVPGQDELPQVFETCADLAARVELNAFTPLRARTQRFTEHTEGVHLAGTETRLQEGDVLLLVGRHREQSAYSNRWDARTAHRVEPDFRAGHTVVHFRESLGHESPAVDPADAPKVFVFRRRAAQFGFNAPDWRLMSDNIRDAFDKSGTATEWPDFHNRTTAERRVDLDAVYPDVLPGGWMMLDKPGYRELYRVEEVLTDARTDFSLTAKTTSLILDTSLRLSWFPLRETTVFAASEELERAPEPIRLPVFGTTIELETIPPGLEPGRVLMVTGLSVQRVQVADRARLQRVGRDVVVVAKPPLTLALDDGTTVTLGDGDVLTVEASPEALPAGGYRWRLVAADGRAGFVDADEDDLEPMRDPEPDEDRFAPRDTSKDVAEVAVVRRVEPGAIMLEAPLLHTYHRDTVTLRGNVVEATHGATASEIVAQLTPGAERTEAIGSGDASTGMQSFRLSQTPLTYVPAATPTGAQSTLTLRIDGVEWQEVASLYGQPGDARVFETRQSADGVKTVRFGNGVNGSRLPTGEQNVTATYRIGIGVAGLVRAGQLQLPMSRPLGLDSVTNPLPTESAQDPENEAEARRNAPLTVLTLDRIVSVQDFEDFARSFAGVGKARAAVLWNGEREIVHLSVGTAQGTPIEPGSALLDNLAKAIDGARHSDQTVLIDSYVEARFGLALSVVVNSDREAEPVLEAVGTALQAAYTFQARDLAQAVTAAEIARLVHSVTGVKAAVLRELDGRDPVAEPVISALPARWEAGAIVPATLLLVDPERIELEVLPV